MQLFVQHDLKEPLVLPISYNHILQSIIYQAISDEKYARFLHDTGYNWQSKNYKFFQFSRINGPYTIKDGKIRFENEIWFEIRSVYPGVILNIKRHFDESGITYIGQHFERVKTFIRDDTVESDEIVIRMLTPVTVHSTDPETRKTYFHSPGTELFDEYINGNFIRKYEAYTGVEPETGIDIRVLSCEEKDKSVVKYKGFYIGGWYGVFLLSGERKYLDFLYQCGLGDRNSQGFGMFEIQMQS